MAKKTPLKFTVKEIPIKLIDNNTGQIEGVPENPRTITKEDFQNLKKSIKDDPDFLQLREPLVFPLNGRYVAIAGNQRIRCLRELPYEFVTVKILDKTTPIKNLKRWAIKDNTNKGEWDIDLLANEWDQDELADWGFDVFDEEPLELPEGIDDVPAPPKKPVSKLGDLWLLGEHRVLCGDSTDKTTIERLMDGKKADMVFTDPPYGMDFQSNFREKTPQFDKIQNDEIVLDITESLLQIMKENCVAYICTRWDLYPQWFEQIQAILQIKNCVVWYKRGGGLGDLENTYSPNHEFIMVAHQGKNPLQGKRDADVWEINRDSVNSYEHPTQKPVALAAFAIEHHSAMREVVADLFLGSGSTLIACEQTERTCYGLELDATYVDVVVSRFIKFTNGEKPVVNAETGEDCRHLFNVI